MNDKELFLDMLCRNGIRADNLDDGVYISEDPHTLYSIGEDDKCKMACNRCDGKSICTHVDGYAGFYTVFRFDPVSGRLMSVGIYE